MGLETELGLRFEDQLFDELSENQRKQLISFVTEKGATLCGESISPMHQHIQSYRDGHGKIQASPGMRKITGHS